jgi:DNA-binding XRE family transcriptional regulator
MDPKRKKRLEARGWKFGTADEFLGLSEEESKLLDLRMALADSIAQMRRDIGKTQAALAKALRTSQSRLSKIETGDPSVSFDLLISTLFKLGATTGYLAKAIKSIESKKKRKTLMVKVVKKPKKSRTRGGKLSPASK